MSELIECSHCGCEIEGEIFEVEGESLCEYCYNDETFICDCCPDDDDSEYIHDYYYKPSPVFHKCSDEENVRYYGIELEIDCGGKDNENAQSIYDTA